MSSKANPSGPSRDVNFQKSLTANWPYQAVVDARVGARRPSVVNGFTAEMLGAQIGGY
jgi:hypothetical protein